MRVLPGDQLDQLLREERPIYVLNNTSPRGILIIQFPNGQHMENVLLPKTAHPVNLSARVPSKSIGESMEFRRFLVRDRIRLVDPESAMEILRDPDVIEELKEATERTFTRGKDGMAPEKVEESAAVEAMKKMVASKQQKTDAAVARNDAPINEPKISTQVKVLMQRLADNEVTIRTAHSNLKALATELSVEDFSYILSQSPTGHIGNWARKKLDKLQSGDDDTTQGVVIED